MVDEVQMDAKTVVFVKHADGGWAEHVVVSDANIDPLGYEQITSLSTVRQLTPPNGARVALIIAEGAPVEWRDDGQNPTASVGMPLLANTPFPYNGDLSAIRFIAQSGSPILNVSYYG